MPLVSVLIPVYNGATYVRSAIATALNQSDTDLEIIVSVDLCSDNSGAIAKSFQDPRLKIFTHTRRLGMTDNYKFLISQAKGEWITIIGQDDALVQFAITKLRMLAEKFPLHEIITSRRSFAFWPDTLRSFGKFSFIYPMDLRKPRLKQSTKFLMNSMSGFREYSEGPQLYTGSFVKRSLIERISLLNKGEFFTYSIPDVSSSINFLLHTSEYIYSPLPLFVVGTSAQSTGIAIDKTVSKSDKPAEISQYFSNSNISQTAPGLGLFTSFSWYMYEAYVETIKNHRQIGLRYNQPKIRKLALVALRYESKQNKIYNNQQKFYFNQLRRDFGLSRIELELREFNLMVFKTGSKVFKYLGAIYLFRYQRLILSTDYDVNSFSLELLCKQVLLQETS